MAQEDHVDSGKSDRSHGSSWTGVVVSAALQGICWLAGFVGVSRIENNRGPAAEWSWLFMMFWSIPPCLLIFPLAVVLWTRGKKSTAKWMLLASGIGIVANILYFLYEMDQVFAHIS
jgi:hypothetical protein